MTRLKPNDTIKASHSLNLLLKTSGAAERDDVDTAHSATHHGSEGRESGTADPKDCKEFDEPRNIVALTDDIGFDLDLSVDITEITGGQYFVVLKNFQ